ncbi:MAG: M13 family metallopeptidase [Terriglobales bacterium]
MRFRALLLILCALALAVPAAFGQSGAIHTGIDLSAIDKTVSPCANFYQYACGRWNATHPIPGDESAWGRFNELENRNQEELRGILERAAAKGKAGSRIQREVGTFYAACVNTQQVNGLGLQPIRPELERIAAIQNRGQLIAEVARMAKTGVPALFSFGAAPDMKDSAMTIAVAGQGGLGLPNRDYYTRTDAKSRALRAKYVAYVAQVFRLLGDAPARAAREARTVMALETSMAEASMELTAQRNPNNVYHKMMPVKLEQLAPALDWKAYFQGVGAPPINAVNVREPKFFAALNQALTTQPLSAWKNYLRFHLANATAPYLAQPLETARFDFYGVDLTGQKVQQPRWKRCVRYTDRDLGEALGQLYVQQYFPPATKRRATQMVAALQRSLTADIRSLPWMTAATKRQALVKLRAVMKKIGYPNRWRDYSSIRLRSDDLLGNVLRADAFEVHRRLKRIGHPPNRLEWGMTPPTVNAYYNPHMNEIVFPAGIMQPPFFSGSAVDAANYGGMGMVIGHEMTHGFDDEGRRFGPKGNLKDWWTAADAKAFQARTQCLVNEYSQFSPVPGVHLNGRLTLGENTADNGGLRISYAALVHTLGRDAMHRQVDGYTMAQIFFLAYGQIWCENVRPQFARMLVTVDPHSPGEFRVNGVVSNFGAFDHAFHCGAGTAMNRGVKACRVW